MTDTITNLANWPRRSNGQPIFKTTAEAIFYAQLIYNLHDNQYALMSYRQRIHRCLKDARESKNPNFDRIMDLAVQAQFYRECLDECQRITDEKFNTPGV